MKRLFVFAAVALCVVACRTDKEKAEVQLEDIAEAAREGDAKEVKELVEEMAIWYEGMSEEEKEALDNEYKNVRVETGGAVLGSEIMGNRDEQYDE